MVTCWFLLVFQLLTTFEVCLHSLGMRTDLITFFISFLVSVLGNARAKLTIGHRTVNQQFRKERVFGVVVSKIEKFWRRTKRKEGSQEEEERR